jgi:hypothetical protein
MKRHTLTREQLKLLSTVGLFGLLEYFSEPKTPSEVAKQIARPANAIHYKAKRLEKAGLLKITEQKGHQKKYQVVSREFRFHKRLLPIVARQFPEGLDQHLKKVQKLFISEVEKDATKEESFKKDKDNPDYYVFDFYNFSELNEIAPSAATLEISLSKQQYLKYQEKLIALQKEITESASQGEVYTFVFLSCKGRASTL